MADEALSAFLQVLFETIAKVILKELELEFGLQGELRNLMETLSMIQAFLKDAEERQQTEEAVKKWLDQLRDVAYDANDLLDELTTEVQRRQLIRYKKVRNSLSLLNPKRVALRHETAHKIEDIKVGLDVIENRRRTFGLRVREGARRSDDRPSTSLNPTPSPPLGREKDKRSVVELLLSAHDEAVQETKISVIPVLGMGGIGKTTLAQLVYNDEFVGIHFQLKLWVHVSRDFDVYKITKCIIEAIQGSAFDPISLDGLQKYLRRLLSGRKYLLVLDDVWCSSPSEWEMLRAPLLDGAKGSKILVTTRSEKVGHIMGTVNNYRLHGLSDDDCWSIFCQQALASDSSDLLSIKNEIVSKCKGLPLAAKVIGLRLRGETDTSKWAAILQDDMTEFGGGDTDIARSIRLSYQQLPAGLKPCFAYCSIFPKGFLFDKELLVQLWMAQNFLQTSGGEGMEDVGGRYFDFLVQWSFFQYSHFDCKNKLHKYTMHNVIHDFAQLVSGVECSIVEIGKPCNISEKTRHCSLVYGTSAPMGSSSSNRGANISEKVNACNSLYTLLAIGGGTVHGLRVPQDLAISKFRCLRSLDFSDSGISEIPKSIDGLKHLRYLQLQNTSIRRLPKSLGYLYNLQTLGLRNCYDLEELPKKTSYLHKLRHLDLRLDGDDLVTVSEGSRWGSLRSMPPRIGELTELQTLSRFVVGTKKRCGLSELQKLNSLRGELLISNLHLVRNAAEATDADLVSKEHLHQLELRWGEGDGGFNALNWDANIIAEEVLGSLKPHTNIKEVNVVGYKGESFPSWIGHSSFSNIKSLVLSDCKNCHTLPSIGHLPSLKALYIKGMDAVTLVGCAFCGAGARKFPALEKLHFERMRKLQAWCGDEKCELRSLRELVFKDCVDLRQITHKLPSLTKLVIEGSRWLIGLPSFPSLSCLEVKASGEWIVESCRRLPSLSSLTIAQLPTRTLHLGLQRDSYTLRRLEISHCDQLASLADDWLPVSLTYLAICRYCPQLRALPGGLKDLVALEDMEIEDCAQLQTLPDSLPKALQFLSIDDCPALSQRCRGQHWDKIARLSSVWIDKQQVVSGQPKSMD